MVYQLKIQLLGVKKPPVWRRVLVDADITFDNLHEVIQTAMGWGNCHLYQFGYEAYNPMFNIGVPQPDDWDPPRFDSRKTQVCKYLNDKNPKMKYVYDFGDDWIHDVILEKTMDDWEVTEKLPVCIVAKGACPPEDCGGPWGYEELKALLDENVLDEESMYRLEWYGMTGYFDAKFCDIDLINNRLADSKFKKPRNKRRDPVKLEERVTLLKTLTGGFCRNYLKNMSIVGYCDEIIQALTECDDFNLANGDPDIWAAAIVLTADELHPEFCDTDDFLHFDEVCDFFKVKQGSVRRRFYQIMEADWQIEDCNYNAPDEDA